MKARKKLALTKDGNDLESMREDKKRALQASTMDDVDVRSYIYIYICNHNVVQMNLDAFFCSKQRNRFHFMVCVNDL